MARWMLILTADRRPMCLVKWNPGAGLDFSASAPGSLREYVMQHYGQFDDGDSTGALPSAVVIEWPEDPPSG